MANFKFIGGRACLDFVNTVGGRVSIGPRLRDYSDRVLRDKFKSCHDLLTWGELAGVLSRKQARRLARHATRSQRDAEATLARALKLRRALYRIFKCVVENWQPEARDMKILRTEVSIAQTRQKLERTGVSFTWVWEGANNQLDRVLWPVALCAASLLASPDLAGVCQCAGDECGWLFLDTSRNHSRQWCDMRDCGNRAKVKRFRQRQRRSQR